MTLSKKQTWAIAIVLALGFVSVGGGFFAFHSLPRTTMERWQFPIYPAFMSLIYVGTGLSLMWERARSPVSTASGVSDTAEAELSRRALARWGNDSLVLGLSTALLTVVLLLSPVPVRDAYLVCNCFLAIGIWTVLIRFWLFRRRQRR